MIRRNWKGQQGTTLAAWHSFTIDIDGETAGFAHDLAGPSKSVYLASARTTLVTVGLPGLVSWFSVKWKKDH